MHQILLNFLNTKLETIWADKNIFGVDYDSDMLFSSLL
jgi:hypothetical protein